MSCFHLGKVYPASVPCARSGCVVAYNYAEPDFEQPAPYQVQLDGGKLIYAPEDTDECIMGEVPPLDYARDDGR